MSLPGITVTRRKEQLSKRLRPKSEAAPWVIAEVKKLEARIAELEAFAQQCADMSGGMVSGNWLSLHAKEALEKAKL
ncbi:MAG: hypothetical protein CMJ75_19065 [Planctomycetaceae bacterium]|nr:hypothetical protein [Planctomycetaceae bacterium]